MNDGTSAQARGDWMRERGYWADRVADDYLRAAVATHLEKPAIVAYRADAGLDAPDRTLTYAELEELVSRAAGAFRAMGIGRGDVVAVMLPNWWEFVVASYALARIGAICNPLMHIFRERELRFMLRFAQTKAIIAPASFRGFDFPRMLVELQVDLPDLRRVIVVGEPGPDGFEAALLESGAPPIPNGASGGLRADEVCVLMYTSGTTGEPKAVMHSFNTMFACTRALAARFGHRPDDVHQGSTPFGHMTGYAAVMLQALYQGSTMVLQDVWTAEDGVRIMTAEGVTHMAGATPFLADICRVVREGAPAPRFRTFLCGGAQIPPVVIEEAQSLLGVPASSLFGMTETLGGSLTEPERAAEKSASSDGRPLDGMELSIVDDALDPLPAGRTGRLLARGAQLFLGYYKRPDLSELLPGGWFDTGDRAYMDAEGYIRIDGRTKDILIRGGENVPVVEIEALLYRHPAVQDVALVGIPDPRLGERGCAFITLKPGREAPSLAEMQAFLAASGTAKQYWPERLEVIAALPRTASGKIQKFLLRERAKDLAAP